MLSSYTRKVLVSTFLLLCALVPAFAGKPIALFKTTAHHPDYSRFVSEATYLELDRKALEDLMLLHPSSMTMRIPKADGSYFDLVLSERNILSEGFDVRTPDGRAAYVPGHYYSGKVAGADESAVAISLFRDLVMGVISVDGSNYVLGHTEQNRWPASSTYILYDDHDLLITNDFDCKSDDLGQHPDEIDNLPQLPDNVGQPVNVYFQADYQLYLDKGSNVTTATNYVTGLFNNVATLYNNEQLTVQISSIFVWTTQDPYPTSSSSSALTAFGSALNGNFNGNLAHLLSTVSNGNGGVAYLNALCNPSISYAYSNIGTSYSTFPTYSWSVMVVTHELGHNLGSPHTHSCVWGANGSSALDNCYTTDGGCAAGPAPTTGGTIMSYCHLASYGINFSNGFGLEPGNRIRDYVQSATCLIANNMDCASATPLTCGTPYTSTTTSGTDTTSAYSCASGSYDGSERVHVLTLAGNQSLNIKLVGASGLDVFLLSQCNPSNCIGFGTDSINVDFLAAGTYYVVVDGLNNYSGSYTLTVNCGPPGYCASSGGTPDEWIQAITIGSLTNTSGNNGGYLNATSQVLNASVGNSYSVSLTPGFTSTTYAEWWRIWVDYNNDSDFDDADEKVFDSNASSSTMVTGTIAIANNAPTGNHRMRISMKYAAAPSPCETFTYGEVEDYTINIGGTPVGLDCVNAVTLSCGTPYTSTNSLGYNGVYSYDCASTWNETGPERLHQITTTAAGTLKATLSGTTANLDVFILSACDSAACVAFGGDSAILNNAAIGTYYIVVDGSDGAVGNYTLTVSCPEVVDTTYCTSSATNSSYEWLQSVSIGTFSYASGNNNGYLDATAQVITLNADSTVAATLTAGYAGTVYNEYWTIWIDYNNDFDFDDAGEKVLSSGTTSSTTSFTGSFTAPSTSTGITTRMRVKMDYVSSTSSSPCDSYAYGETEDYTVVISPANVDTSSFSCQNAIPLTCGVAFTATTTGASSEVQDYPCIGWNESGPERVHIITTEVDGPFTFGLTDMTSDLDAFLLNACDSNACIAYANSFYTVSSLPAGTYYLIVDGYAGATGPYTLTATCAVIPDDSTYCASAGDDASLEWIDSVAIGDMVNLSGSNDGYLDSTELVINAAQGDSVSFALVPGFSAIEYNEYWGIWIDYNQDFDFDDAGENVFITPIDTNIAQYGTIVIPEDAPLGTTRVRVKMIWSLNPLPCGGFSYGEVEDYTINITEMVVDTGYCDPDGNSDNLFADIVQVGSLESATGNNGGYLVSFDEPAEVFAGLPVQVSLLPGFGEEPAANYWNIWVDYNNNQDFSDEGENVFTGSSPNEDPTFGTFGLPADAALGNYMMRVSVSDAPLTDPCYSINAGESEDYLLTISNPCVAPSGFGYVHQSTNRVFVYWNAVPLSQGYKIRWRKQGNTNWIATQTQTATSRLINNVLANSTYEVEVLTICPLGETTWSQFTFHTNYATTCTTPTGMYAIPLTPTEERVYWNHIPSATKYWIRYRPNGSTTWTGKNASIANYKISNLQPATEYQYQLRTYCNGAWTGYGPINTFTTMPQPTSGLVAEGNTNAVLGLYPNPTSNTLYLNLHDVAAQTGTLRIMGTDGRVYLEQKNWIINEPVSVLTLPQGVYSVTVHVIGEQPQTQRFVKIN